MRGRKPKPAEVHERNGTYEKHPDRRNESLPPVVVGIPLMPDAVESDPVAAAKWGELIDIMQQMRTVSPAYRDMMEAYCVTFALYRKSLAAARMGVVLKTESGMKRNPAAVDLNAHLDRLGKLQSEMGLTPSARARLKVDDDKGDADPVLAMLQKMQKAREAN
jgi:P27 family predicted phage terminase small subunit